MRLFLAVAVVAVLTIIVLAMQRSGPRVTQIERRVERHDEKDGDA